MLSVTKEEQSVSVLVQFVKSKEHWIKQVFKIMFPPQILNLS